ATAGASKPDRHAWRLRCRRACPTFLQRLRCGGFEAVFLCARRGLPAIVGIPNDRRVVGVEVSLAAGRAVSRVARRFLAQSRAARMGDRRAMADLWHACAMIFLPCLSTHRWRRS
ncbi:hypothetical protein, partial [Burkholderia sp. 3C]